MATQTITGAYPSGYDLDPAYDTLEIASSAIVGGTGVTTSAAQPSTIDNVGNVHGTANGITLSAGGVITNGVAGATSQTASIAGTSAIVANGGAATIMNFATISSDSVASGNTTTTGPSIVLNAGGKVANTGSDAVISNGIAIAGATGEVVNRSTIGGVVTYTYVDDLSNQTHYGPSISMSAGGAVNNGANGNTQAEISDGISIAGGAGSIINNGTIRGQKTVYFNDGDVVTNTSYAIELSNGGTIRNGTGSNRTATIGAGISISGAAGSIDNQGTIAVPRRGTDYAIILSDGGNIVNGSASNADAVIAGLTQGISLKGKGVVQNYGTISGNRNALVFRSSNDTLIQEGTGVLDGKVIGGGGSLILGAEAGAGSIARIGRVITGFAHISVAATATWTLTGSTLIEGPPRVGEIGTVFDNQGTLNTSVSFTNDGFFKNEGTFTASSNVTNRGSFQLYGTTTVGKLNNRGGASLSLYDDAPLTAQRIVNSGQIATIGLDPHSTIKSDILNLGSISGSFRIDGNITGSGGVLAMRRNEVMELNGKVATGQRVSFLQPQGTLKLDQSGAFQAVISGFDHGDRIDLGDVLRAGSTLSFVENDSNTRGVLTITNGNTKVALTFEGNYAASQFRLKADGNGNVEIAYASPSASAANTARAPADTQALAESLFNAAFAPGGSDSVSTWQISSAPAALAGAVFETAHLSSHS